MQNLKSQETGFNWMEKAEERIGELEESPVETSQSEQ